MPLQQPTTTSTVRPPLTPIAILKGQNSSTVEKITHSLLPSISSTDFNEGKALNKLWSKRIFILKKIKRLDHTLSIWIESINFKNREINILTTERKKLKKLEKQTKQMKIDSDHILEIFPSEDPSAEIILDKQVKINDSIHTCHDIVQKTLKEIDENLNQSNSVIGKLQNTLNRTKIKKETLNESLEKINKTLEKYLMLYGGSVHKIGLKS